MEPLSILAVILLAGYAVSLYANGEFGLGTGGGLTASLSPDNSDNTPAPNWILGPHMPITNDRNTWPTGDRIWLVCQAIARAEGADIAGSVPDRNNNPGDLSDGFAQYGGEVVDSKVTRFPDKETGWQWLYNKIQNIWLGRSTVYSADMTWNQIAQHYAGNWQNWATNVSHYLGVDPNSTLRQYLG